MNPGEADTIGLTDKIRMLGTNSTASMSIDLRAAAVPSTNLLRTTLSLTRRAICLPRTKHMTWCCDSATCPTRFFRPRPLLLMSMPDSSLPEIPVEKESRTHATRVFPRIGSMAKANPSTATQEYRGKSGKSSGKGRSGKESELTVPVTLTVKLHMDDPQKKE